MVHIAACGHDKIPLVSPKRDDAGFCKPANDNTCILIPERPGNNLIFGLQAMLENPHVGLCFLIPGNDSTLRVGGTVTLSRNTQLCQESSARGIKSRLMLIVKVDYAFFHCSKAYMRSKLWKPETWLLEEDKVTFGRYVSSLTPIQNLVNRHIDEHYVNVQKAIDGEQPQEE